MIRQISSASQEQTVTANQISKNIDAISSVTQESTSGVQQIARTAEDLNRLTENLQHLIDRFDVADGAHHMRSGNHQRTPNGGRKIGTAVSSNGHLVHG